MSDGGDVIIINGKEQEFDKLTGISLQDLSEDQKQDLNSVWDEMYELMSNKVLRKMELIKQGFYWLCVYFGVCVWEREWMQKKIFEVQVCPGLFPMY